MGDLRDKLWLWAHEAGSYTGQHGLPGVSRITPAEAASYLSIPNVIMVQYGGQPQPPFDQLATSLLPMKQVVWSIVGARGKTTDSERAAVLDVAARFPNITGVIMDDFFGAADDGSRRVVMPLDTLCEVRSSLVVGDRRLDLWVVLYTEQLDEPVSEHLQLCDKVTLWTWRADQLRDLERNFAQLKRLAPSIGKLLGSYMWDFAAARPMPLDLMQHQCELGLHWLKEGAIEGMIFLGSPICDLGLDAVDWTRQWLVQLGGVE
jgi:hypothetical protein